jgi:ABC-type uncharacterized transport system substrate-binding protein
MRRREFISLLGGAASWPLAARAQQAAMPVVGYLHQTSFADWAPFVDAFREGLKEAGFVEGRNVVIEFRWGEGNADLVPELAAELVRRQVSAIFTNATGALAAKAITTTIPIIFAIGADPIRIGLVASLNRPGGNVTGVSTVSDELVGKRVGLLHDLIPQARTIALLGNRNTPDGADQLRRAQEAASALGKDTRVFNASTIQEIDASFANLAQQRADALLVAADPFLTSRRQQIVALAAHLSLPAIYSLREWAVAGGLISYSTSQRDAHRQAGIYTGRILAGGKSGDLPVLLPTRFELVINLRTAKSLGLVIPPGLLAIADEVIE